MSTIVEVIRGLPNLLPLNAAATITEITDAEIQLRVRFAKDYSEYLSVFGAILADGIELTGIAKSEHRNVVSVTKREWELNANVRHTMYVIENTRVDGIVIWQDSTGIIYQTSPNSAPRPIAGGLAEYLKSK
jgi:hypothetical protein